jgi:phage terminase large subunit GpA-like protein
MVALAAPDWLDGYGAAWRPPPKVSLSEWADKHFRLSSGSADAGRWHTRPYQREILDALIDPAVEWVSVIKSARIGWTEMIKAATAYFMKEDPCPIIGVLPTVELAEIFSREMLAPMLREMPVLAELIQGAAVKTTGRTMLHKTFPGGVMSLVGANSAAGLSMLSRRLLWLDEVDRMPLSAGGEGDPVALAVTRTKTFWNRKIMAGGTPTIAEVSRIAELFEAGDQRRRYWPCPHCGHFDFLVFRERPDGRGHVMRWPDGRPDAACFECASCHLPIDESHKSAMDEAGEWRADAPYQGDPSVRIHASFSIWTAYSTSPNAGWGEIATEFTKANKLGSEKLRVFVNTVLGETWQERGEAPPWEGLYQRRETYEIGTVPAGVIVVTAGVDVQKDRLVPEVVGWGANRESWSIFAEEIHGDTALLVGPESPWVKLDELLARTFPGADGRVFTIARMAVDGGWQTTNANTQVVYAWGRTHERSRVMVTKGVQGARALIETATPVDVTLAGKKIQRGYRVWPIGVDVAKGELYGWLRLQHVEGDPPPGYCHFPEHPAEYFRQLTAEHLMTHVNPKTRVKTLRWEGLPNRENHALDARILARVAAAAIGIDRLATRSAPPPPAGSPGTPPPAASPIARPAPPSAAPRASIWNRPRGGGGLGRRR